ncbi:uncharacterized protein LOC129726520 [Wyeomyia smithii]|uniref:uncharacterized protein LOC129726520 n=1 Tax=Wyeomyia smithii TaxID=174621 RepID=UPI002467EB1E|nr:uncharacterized protein LOC129726520 [Wyeomyia smithii]
MIYSRGFITIFLATSLLAIGSASRRLTCDHCSVTTNWNDCERLAKPAECGVLLTNDLHFHLGTLNPSLPLSRPADRRYKCYSIELNLNFVLGPSRMVYQKGCTYEEAHFCDGWNTVPVNSVICSTNSTGVAPIDD